MKPLFIIVAAILTFTACNNNTATDSETRKEIVGDTSTTYSNSILTDTGSATTTAIPAPPPAKAKTIEPKKAAKPSNNLPSPHPVVSNSTPVDNTPAVDNATTSTTNTEPELAPEEKKGMSSAAKGAIIGGGAGAIGGAIISKRKGTGAVIGGVLGAAGGYIIGRKKDKNDTIK